MPIKYRAKIAFVISSLALLTFPLLLPSLRLFYFAPFIIICLYKHTRFALLWRASLCGTIVDLLSSGPLVGMTALNYSIVSFLLYGQTRNFFEDKLSTLPLMTFLFSVFSTLLTLLFSPFSGLKLHLSWLWIVTDLLCMPAADALYALFAFSLPFELSSIQKGAS